MHRQLVATLDERYLLVPQHLRADYLALLLRTHPRTSSAIVFVHTCRSARECVSCSWAGGVGPGGKGWKQPEEQFLSLQPYVKCRWPLSATHRQAKAAPWSRFHALLLCWSGRRTAQLLTLMLRELDISAVALHSRLHQVVLVTRMYFNVECRYPAVIHARLWQTYSMRHIQR